MAGSDGNNDRSSEELIFLLDSGASDYLVNKDDIFSDVTELESPMKISVATNCGVQGVLEDVLYCPDVPHNLLYIRGIQEAGMSVLFYETGNVKVTRAGKLILKGKSVNNLIGVTLKVQNINVKTHQANVSFNVCSYKLWHERLGHIGKQKFLQLKHKQMVDDIKLIEKVYLQEKICEACIYGKQARLPFAKAKGKSYVKRPLFIIYSDVCGPITPTTYDKKNYLVVFIDDYTHYTVTYLISYKSEVFTAFKDFVAKSQVHFNLKIVYLYCDNGGEYLSKEFKNFCVQKGISYHLTVPYTPQQNSGSERKIRTITEKGRSMISGADMDKCFWGEAVLTATYIINRSPTKALMVNKTPYEMWHGKKPRLSHLRIFGSTVHIHKKNQKGQI